MKAIGIIVSNNEEREAILNIMKDVKVEQLYNLRFLRGEIKGKRCILVKSGIGKVNAARTTQLMLDKFDIHYIIDIGVGGAINPMLNIGDLLVAKYVVQHDFDITAFGHSKGYITGVGNTLSCDIGLVDEVEKIIKKLPERNYNIKFGTIATGDIFCTEVVMKDKIRAKFNADVVDMECAGIAQTCYLCNMPFIALKSISNIPNSKNEHDYNTNVKLASKRCANILKEIIN